INRSGYSSSSFGVTAPCKNAFYPRESGWIRATWRVRGQSNAILRLATIRPEPAIESSSADSAFRQREPVYNFRVGSGPGLQLALNEDLSTRGEAGRLASSCSSIAHGGIACGAGTGSIRESVSERPDKGPFEGAAGASG